jgi:hypothetical protein
VISYLLALTILILGSTQTKSRTPLVFGLTLLAILFSSLDFQSFLQETSILMMVSPSYLILWSLFGFFVVYQIRHPEQQQPVVGPFLGAICAFALFSETENLLLWLRQSQESSSLCEFLLFWLFIKQLTILIGLGITLVLTSKHKVFPWIYPFFYVLVDIVLLKGQVIQNSHLGSEIETLKQLGGLLLTSYMVYFMIMSKVRLNTLMQYSLMLATVVVPFLLSAMLEFYWPLQ